MGDFVTNPARTLTPIGGSQALSEITQAVLDLRAALAGGSRLHSKDDCSNTSDPVSEIGFAINHQGELWILNGFGNNGQAWVSLGNNGSPQEWYWHSASN